MHYLGPSGSSQGLVGVQVLLTWYCAVFSQAALGGAMWAQLEWLAQRLLNPGKTPA